jgi:hypothetical protein
MLCEGVITSVVTLNFDLAISHAVVDLGVGLIVGIVEGPYDLPKQRNVNVYYLHRNVNATDVETWVLRTAILQEDWKRHWQAIIATKVLVAPVVVFAGLGTPVAVLVESTKLLREALPQTTKLYQVDPGEYANSKFFEALQIDPSAYIQRGWCQLMEELSERLSTEHIAQLQRAVGQKTIQDHLQTEDVSSLLNRLGSLGIVTFGKIRALWLLHDRPYRRVDADGLSLIADLLLALGTIMRVSGTAAVILEDGHIEFRYQDRIVAGFLIASGCGHRGKAAVEAAVESRRGRYRTLPDPPRAVFVGGTADIWTTQPTSPRDIVQGELKAEDIITGPTSLPLHHITELRSNPDLIRKLVPLPVTQEVR